MKNTIIYFSVLTVLLTLALVFENQLVATISILWLVAIPIILTRFDRKVTS